MSEISVDDIKAAHENLRELLAVPFEKQNISWERELYKRVPLCWYDIVGTITDPNGRLHAAVELCRDDHWDRIRKNMFRPVVSQNKVVLHNTESLVRECLTRIAGIAIISRQEDGRPDAKLRFGSVWSYYEYQRLAGCGNVIADFEKAYAIDPENPLDLMAEDTTGKVRLSTPSSRFFPDYVRDLITEEIRKEVPDATPEFRLMEETQYAIPFSIFVQFNTEIPRDQVAHIRDNLTWYMPPYLPVRVG